MDITARIQFNLEFNTSSKLSRVTLVQAHSNHFLWLELTLGSSVNRYASYLINGTRNGSCPDFRFSWYDIHGGH